MVSPRAVRSGSTQGIVEPRIYIQKLLLSKKKHKGAKGS